MVGGGGGGSGSESGPDGAPDATGAAGPIDDEDLASWPGLESLPPSPPLEYPPARPFRRRRAAEPLAVALPPPGTVAAAATVAVPTPPPPTRRWPLIAAAAVAVVLLLLVPALVVLGRDDASEEQAAAGPSTTTSVPSSTSTTELGAAPPPPDPTSTTTAPALPPLEVVPDPQLEAAIAEVSPFVAGQRGLAFAAPVEGIRMPDDEFEERLRQQAMQDAEAIEAEGHMLELLGLIPPDTDYLSEYLATFPAMAGAYFDPVTKRIVARGEPGTPVDGDLRVTLAHELTHALDYEAFDLYDRSYNEPDSERQFGLDALVEGDAERIEHQWARAHGEPVSSVSADGYDDFLSSSTAVVYELGERLVDDIVARGGEPQLNADFDDPPSTSEQIMHPEKYAVREVGVPLDEPTADGSPLWKGVTGEYTTGQMLRTAVTPEVADRAAAGWGNDKGVLWLQSPAEGGLTCRRIAYAMDTPADLAELDDAFTAWARAAPNRTALLEADRLVVTMCDDVPPPPVDYGRDPSPI